MPKGNRGKRKPDYAGWILRTIEKREDLLFAYGNSDIWTQFVNSKVMPRQGYELTPAQKSALLDLQNKAQDIPRKLGFKVEFKTRYRDARNRWTRADATGDKAPVKADRVWRYRDYDSRRFIKKAKADELFDTARGSESWKGIL